MNISVVLSQSDSKCWNVSQSNYSKLKSTIFIQICIYLTSESLTVTVQIFTLTWLIFAAPDVKSAWVNILAEKGQSSHMLLYRMYTWRGFSYTRPCSGITHEKACLWELSGVYCICALTHSGNCSDCYNVCIIVVQYSH